MRCVRHYQLVFCFACLLGPALAWASVVDDFSGSPLSPEQWRFYDEEASGPTSPSIDQGAPGDGTTNGGSGGGSSSSGCSVAGQGGRC